MSQVRRCDNPGCTSGPAGTPSVSDNANPDTWLQVTVSPVIGSDGSGPDDACSADCVTAIVAAKTA